jgi:hypothetical protein
MISDGTGTDNADLQGLIECLLAEFHKPKCEPLLR